MGLGNRLWVCLLFLFLFSFFFFLFSFFFFFFLFLFSFFFFLFLFLPSLFLFIQHHSLFPKAITSKCFMTSTTSTVIVFFILLMTRQSSSSSLPLLFLLSPLFSSLPLPPNYLLLHTFDGTSVFFFLSFSSFLLSPLSLPLPPNYLLILSQYSHISISI